MKERIVYGINTVLKVCERGDKDLLRVYIQDDLARERLKRVRDGLRPHSVETERVSAHELESLTGTAKHQGVAAAMRARGPMDDGEALELIEATKNPLILVLDGVEDPRNFGACLRTADAAGVDLVVTGRSRGVDITPVVSKVASGAAEVQPQARVANLARFLKSLQDLNVWITGADEHGESSLFDVRLDGPTAIVLGAEGKGLRRLTREHCDNLVHLPMRGSVESLNVAVATGICLYEALRQRG